jgi:hypothetical protein
MSYRVCRKTTSTTFKVNDQLCKIFLEPMREYMPGFWLWNVGFAVGRSKRQLNDWYWNRKNKRARAIRRKLVGKAGIKTIAMAFDNLLLMRWHLPPGDGLVLDCTSGDPERQFKAWQRWRKEHQDCLIDYECKEFYWFRPPYFDDPVYQNFKVVPVTPPNKRMSWYGPGYHQCFDTLPRADHKHQPMEQTVLQASQDPPSQ